MEHKECKSSSLMEFQRAKKRGYPLPVRWHHFETFPVLVRHHCLKIPRSRWTHFLRQQVARG